MSLVSVVNRANSNGTYSRLGSTTNASNATSIKLVSGSDPRFVFAFVQMGTDGDIRLRRYELTNEAGISNINSNYYTSASNDMAIYTGDPDGGTRIFTTNNGNNTFVSSVTDTNNYTLVTNDENVTNLTAKIIHAKPSSTTVYYVEAGDSKVYSATIVSSGASSYTLNWSGGTKIRDETTVSKIISSPGGDIYYLSLESSVMTIRFGGSAGTSFTQVTGLPGNIGLNNDDYITTAEFDPSGNLWMTGSNVNNSTTTYFLKKYVFNSGSKTAGSVTSTQSIANAPIKGLLITNIYGNGYYAAANGMYFTNPLPYYFDVST
jgi:hypothetical protein